MVKGKPYVHWKIKDEVDLTEIDPTYLWGTVIETNKGPIDEPVFITNAKQAKSIFNYNLDPFFANGGRYCVVVRAYGTETDSQGNITNKPTPSHFEFTLDKDFTYYYVDYEYYKPEDIYPKATIKVKTSTLNDVRPIVIDKNDTTTTDYTTLDVAFYQGRWRVCSGINTKEAYYPDVTIDGQATPVVFKIGVDAYSPEANNPNKIFDGEVLYFAYDNNNYKVVNEFERNEQTGNKIIEQGYITKAFNESDITKAVTVEEQEIKSGTSVISLVTKYPGDFYIPVTVQQGKRQGYRVSIVESEDYTILLSDASTLTYIKTRINERAENVIASITEEGEDVETAIKGENIVLPPIDTSVIDGTTKYLPAEAQNKQAYIDLAISQGYPIGSIFANVAKENSSTDASIKKGMKIPYEFKLEQVSSSMADGSNGPWLDAEFRLPPEYRVQAHQDALSYLANIKLSGIFCMYGEDDIQKIYTDHVNTTEPNGMNSKEVCKWRQLIIGCNAIDRERNISNDVEGQCFNFYDKSIAADNEAICLLGQGLIDTGFVPQAHDPVKDNDPYMAQYQLLPYECTQYLAGLRSGLFYGDAIFGGEGKKQIRGIGKLSIAPLFSDENKVLWQPDIYTILNEYGILTFTNEYGQISLTDGVTTRQDPLQEDEEGVVSIINYAKHAVHETLLKYIGKNITSDLQTGMEVEVRNVLNTMYTVDKTLIDLPEEGYSAFDVEIVLAPKSNAKQILSKVYVYLKITPVHALRQIEVELTVQ